MLDYVSQLDPIVKFLGSVVALVLTTLGIHRRFLNHENKIELVEKKVVSLEKNTAEIFKQIDASLKDERVSRETNDEKLAEHIQRREDFVRNEVKELTRAATKVHDQLLDLAIKNLGGKNGQ